MRTVWTSCDYSVEMGIDPSRAILLLFIPLLLSFPSRAQDETRGGGKGEDDPFKVPDSLAQEPDPDRVLLVPYEPNHYDNELEKEMKEETGLRLRQIRKRLRFGLDNKLLEQLEDRGETISYMRENDPDLNYELKYLYRTLAYDYRPVPQRDLDALEEEEEKEKGPFKKLFGGSEDEKEQSQRDSGAGRNVMEKGQIKDRPDRRVRFMDARIRQKELLDHVSRKYGVGYLLFINQLDLKPRKNEPGKLAAGTHDNLIKVHYTIMDHEGNKIEGGAALVSYPSRVKDLNGLIKDYFPVVAERIADRLEEGKKAE